MLIDTDIRDRYSERRKSLQLGSMREHQDWVKMHADTAINEMRCGVSYGRFAAMVKAILPDEKYEMFMRLLRFPLPSTQVVSVVFDRLSRIFEGRNPAINYQFTKTEYADNWEWYRQEMLGEPNVWKTKGWDYFRTEPNSVLVVDMPTERTDKSDRYVQPYFYWVTVDNIIDYDTDETGAMRWIIFRNDDTKMVYEMDDVYYRAYSLTDDGLGEMLVENEHGLGYCPAMFFVGQCVSLSAPDVKESPITKVLSELDWYNFYATSKKHLDLYASYPIYYGYEADCDYEAELRDGHRERCDHGLLVNEKGELIMDADGRAKRCPKCSSHRTAGAGSYIEVPVPSEGEIDFGDHPVGMLSVDKNSLQFNSDELARKKKDLISLCVGVDADTTLSEFSVSDKQVDANYESQSTILVRVKKTFENAQKFVDDTICRLRYGKEFVSSSIDYGTEFYTLSTSELRERLKKAIDSGASESDLASLRKQIVETEYRTNPLQMQRMLILTDIEPLLGMSKTQAMDACNKGFVDEADCKVKCNFESLIKRFEREYGNIIEFGEGDADYVRKVGSNGEEVRSKMPYSVKIDTIKSILKEYVNEIRVRQVNAGVVQGMAE